MMKHTFLLCVFCMEMLLGYSGMASETSRFKLMFGEVPCVQDTLTRTFYYSVSPDSLEQTVEVHYESDTIALYIDDELYEDGDMYSFLNIREKKNYALRTVSVSQDTVFYKLVLTTLPLVCIDASGAEIIKDVRTDCEFTLIDPRMRTPDSTAVFIHKAGVKVRGASSSGYPKKPYSIELQDETGEEVDASLLGMREDGDWILDAMYIDHARMRNRLCTDIWNSFNNVPHLEKEPEAYNGTHGYFVEVFVDDEYNGLYCFTEKIDRKQLKLKKYKEGYKGVSYKAKTWNTLLGNGDYDPNASMDSLLWNGYEAEYPGEEGQAGWEYLKDFLEFVSFKYNSDPETFAQNVENHVHIDNIIDYTLFISAVCALDNSVKNMFLSIYNVQKDTRFFITPWDLDATFGRTYDGSKVNRFAFTNNFPFSNVLIKRLYEGDICNFRDRLESRWKELRTNKFAVDSVADRIIAYKDLLFSSGAFEREQAMWSENCTEIESEAQFMIDWYKKNFDVMDKFILDPLVKLSEKTGIRQYLSVKKHTLMLDVKSGLPVDVVIMDSSGKIIVYKEKVISWTLDIATSGVYFIKLIGEGEITIDKLVISD